MGVITHTPTHTAQAGWRKGVEGRVDFLLHVAFVFLFYCEALLSYIDNASVCGGCLGLGVCLGGGTVGF